MRDHQPPLDLFDDFTEQARSVVALAIGIAGRDGTPLIVPEHIDSALQLFIAQSRGSGFTAEQSDPFIPLSDAVVVALTRARELALRDGSRRVSVAHLRAAFTVV